MKNRSKPKIASKEKKSMDQEQIVGLLLELRKDVNRMDRGLIENSKKIAKLENNFLKIEEF